METILYHQKATLLNNKVTSTNLDDYFQELKVQRVPALRAFWDLEKPCHMKFVLVGLYCGPLLMLNPPLART